MVGACWSTGGTAIEGDTREALSGLVGGCMGGNDSMLPVVVAVGKARELQAWDDLASLVGGGGVVDIGGMLLVVATSVN